MFFIHFLQKKIISGNETKTIIKMYDLRSKLSLINTTTMHDLLWWILSPMKFSQHRFSINHKIVRSPCNILLGFASTLFNTPRSICMQMKWIVSFNSLISLVSWSVGCFLSYVAPPLLLCAERIPRHCRLKTKAKNAAINIHQRRYDWIFPFFQKGLAAVGFYCSPTEGIKFRPWIFMSF